jgi:hypothetical protein
MFNIFRSIVLYMLYICCLQFIYWCHSHLELPGLCNHSKTLYEYLIVSFCVLEQTLVMFLSCLSRSHSKAWLVSFTDLLKLCCTIFSDADIIVR